MPRRTMSALLPVLGPFYPQIIHYYNSNIHWEHWSCPDAEPFLTGIDYYDHPKLCREKMATLYPQLNLGVPQTDEPKIRPENQAEKSHGRWGDSYSTTPCSCGRCWSSGMRIS